MWICLREYTAAASFAALRAARKLGIAMAATIIIGTRIRTETIFVTSPPIARDFPPYSFGLRLILFSATTHPTIPPPIGRTNMPITRKLRIPITSDAVASPVFNCACG